MAVKRQRASPWERYERGSSAGKMLVERKRNRKEARKSRFAKVNYWYERIPKGSAGAEWNQCPTKATLVNGKLSLKRGNVSWPVFPVASSTVRFTLEFARLWHPRHRWWLRALTPFVTYLTRRHELIIDVQLVSFTGCCFFERLAKPGQISNIEKRVPTAKGKIFRCNASTTSSQHILGVVDLFNDSRQQGKLHCHAVPGEYSVTIIGIIGWLELNVLTSSDILNCQLDISSAVLSSSTYNTSFRAPKLPWDLSIGISKK